MDKTEFFNERKKSLECGFFKKALDIYHSFVLYSIKRWTGGHYGSGGGDG